MIEVKNEIAVILGRKGQGKSTLAAELSSKLSKVIIIDSLNEYKDNVRLEIDRDLKKNLDFFFSHSSEFKISFCPETTQEFDDLLEVLKRYSDYTLLLDEIGLWSTPSYIPEPLYWLLRFGRHNRINQIYIARRPPELNRMITALADKFYIFNIIEPRDLEFISKILGEDITDKIKNIKKFSYITYTISEGYTENSL